MEIEHKSLRYPVLGSFGDSEADRWAFQGRTAEKNRLLHLILAEKLAILFGKSGVGKTSLLSAGVFHELRDKGYFPVFLRFPQKEEKNLSLALMKSLREKGKESSVILEPEAGEKEGKWSLWEFFKRVEIWSPDDRLLTPVLILDQFEEFFSLFPQEQQKRFIQELAGLVRGQIPEEIQSEMNKNEDFPLTEFPPPIKVVLSMREDYLFCLEALTEDIPLIFQKRFRLTSLSREQAKTCIEAPAQIPKDLYQTRPFRVDPKISAGMFPILDPKGMGIDPFLLQILCHDLERVAFKRQQKGEQDITISSHDWGNDKSEEVLSRYYKNKLDELSPQEREQAQVLCEEHFIRNKKRVLIEESYIPGDTKEKEKLLHELMDARLIRSEIRGGSQYFELSHDTLIETLLKNLRGREEKERSRVIEEKTRNVEKKKRKKLLGIMVGTFALSLLGLWYLLFLILSSPFSYQEARRLNEEGKTIEAIELYKDTVKKSPDFLPAYLELGGLYYIREEWSLLESLFKKALAEDLQSVFLEMRLGEAYYNLDNQNQSQRYFQQVKERYPQFIQSQKEHQEIETLFLVLGVWEVEQGNVEKALDLYQEAIKLNPDFAQIYSALEEILEQQGKEKEMTPLFEIALDVPFGESWYFNDLGDKFFDRGNYEKAIQSYQKAIGIDPNDLTLYENLGVAYENAGKQEEALKIYEEMTSSPQEELKSIARMHFNMGNIFRSQGKMEKAILAFEKSTLFYPSADFYINLGNIFFRQKQWKKAIENYQKALGVDSNSYLAYQNLGRLFENKGEAVKANEYYQKALEIEEKTQ